MVNRARNLIQELTMPSSNFFLATRRTPLVEKTIDILERIIRERSGVSVTEHRDARGAQWALDIQPGIGPEGFRLEGTDGQTRIVGNDERGLLYGVGKFLRSSRYDGGKFTPSAWRGTSVPAKPVRGMYFATHFHNFYHEAPMDIVARYVEDLALWGYNALIVWFDLHHYTGIDDPAAVAMLARLNQLLRVAKSVGMDIGTGTMANEGYSTTPAALRATATGRSHYGVEICPSTPGGEDLILAICRERWDAFADLGLDMIWIWPYDQGGCGCARCQPWGANGMLRMGEKIARLTRSMFPRARIVYSTWLFDYDHDQGEWEGLAKAFAPRPDWVHYLMADSHDEFPSFPLQRGVPGNLPLLNFPEISMWGAWPWGAYGATPLPERFQKLWNVVADKVAGGFPYSEGIYEDLNKAVYSQFYWDPHRPARETVREYVASEFSAEFADDILAAIGIMEKNHGLSTWNWATKPGSRKAVDVPPEDHGAEKACAILQAVDRQIPERTRGAWRWRILLLRAMFDAELRRSQGVPTDAVEAGFRELCSLYHADKGAAQVRPPIHGGERYPLKDLAEVGAVVGP
jgi:hypothetical protein